MIKKKCHFCKYYSTWGDRCVYNPSVDVVTSEMFAMKKGACDAAVEAYQAFLKNGGK